MTLSNECMGNSDDESLNSFRYIICLPWNFFFALRTFQGKQKKCYSKYVGLCTVIISRLLMGSLHNVEISVSRGTRITFFCSFWKWTTLFWVVNSKKKKFSINRDTSRTPNINVSCHPLIKCSIEILKTPIKMSNLRFSI